MRKQSSQGYGVFTDLTYPDRVVSYEQKHFQPRRQVVLVLLYNPSIFSLAFLLPKKAQLDRRFNQNPIQGGIEFREPIIDACRREVEEEVGLRRFLEPPRYIGSELQRCATVQKKLGSTREQRFHAVLYPTEETSLCPREENVARADWVRLDLIGNCVLPFMSSAKHSVFTHALERATRNGWLPYVAGLRQVA